MKSDRYSKEAEKTAEKAEKERLKKIAREYSPLRPLTYKEKLGIISVLILIVICIDVWVFSGILGNGKQDIAEPEKKTAVESTTPVAEAAAPSAPEKDAPLEAENENKNTAGDEDELQSAINTVCEAINKVKKSESFKATKDQDIKLTLDECSIPGVTAIANPIIERFAKRRVTEYSFENGKAYDKTKDEEITVSAAIPPTDRDFALEKEGIASYEITKNGGNNKYIFTLIAETCDLENPAPKYHAMAMDYLDYSTIDISPAQITQADFHYDGATITAEISSDGKLVYFEEYMPMGGTGAGKLVFSVSGTMSGYIDEIWTFE